jgi:hypothetical protein
VTSPNSRDELLSRRPRKMANAAASRFEVEKPLIEDAPEESKVKETPVSSVYKAGVLVKPLTGFYETIGGIVLLADQTCGQAIINSAEEAAKSLDELARTNPKIRRILMRLLESGAITKVVIAHMPIILAVLAHHFPNALKYVAMILTGVKADSE